MKKSILVTLAFSIALVSGTATSATTANATTWHKGTPSWTHGYWHDTSKHPYTTYVFKTNIWIRISGWNTSAYPLYPAFRFPWHGTGQASYKKLSNNTVLVKSFNRQISQWQSTMWHKSSPQNNHLYFKYVGHRHYEKLVRGNK